MADVQITVGLRREAGMDLLALEAAAGRNVLGHELFDKIPAFAGIHETFPQR